MIAAGFVEGCEGETLLAEVVEGGTFFGVRACHFVPLFAAFSSIHATPEAEPCTSESATMHVRESIHGSCRAEPCKFACAWFRFCVSIH